VRKKMIEVKNIGVWYGNIQALNDVSLSLKKGEVVAVIGSNGAGKSTLIKAIAGLLPKRHGEIYFDGQDITGKRPDLISRAGIAVIPENRRLFTSMPVIDNLNLGAYNRLRKGEKNGVAEDIEMMFQFFPRLKERSKQHAGTLSGGEQQMLVIARALMSRPKAILMDEPSIGLAPMIVKEIFKVIGTLREKGYTILLIEQNARLALKASDRAYVMELGRVTIEDRSDALSKSDRVRKLYLSS
jgi:branched-chain amino acid transport system ATP-binding protein